MQAEQVRDTLVTQAAETKAVTKDERRKPKQIKSLPIWSIYLETYEILYKGSQELKACETKKQFHGRSTEPPPMSYKQDIKANQEASNFRKNYLLLRTSVCFPFGDECAACGEGTCVCVHALTFPRQDNKNKN